MIEKIIYAMNLVIMGTIFYTSLTESYLQRSFMVAGITMILSILPIIGQLYALFLSFTIIFLDDREHIKGSCNDKDNMTIRELIVQMMKEDIEEE